MPTNGQRPGDSYEPELTRWRFCDECWVYWRIEVLVTVAFCWLCSLEGRPVGSPTIINAYTPAQAHGPAADPAGWSPPATVAA